LNDSVGQLDSFFPECIFFKTTNKLQKFLDHCNQKKKVDFLTICTPNYLHKEHIMLGLKNNMDVICEKPLVLNIEDISYLKSVEKRSNKKVYTILQLRLMPEMINLKKKISNTKIKQNVSLKYITARGDWFFKSWKGKIEYSGGIATNIGIHFFDLLIWIFGKVNAFKINYYDKYTLSGTLDLDKANVNWLLSLNKKHLPLDYQAKNKTTYRSLKIKNKEFEFSKNFTNLHDLSYKKILDNNGFRISEAEYSIKLCSKIRSEINKNYR